MLWARQTATPRGRTAITAHAQLLLGPPAGRETKLPEQVSGTKQAFRHEPTGRPEDPLHQDRIPAVLFHESQKVCLIFFVCKLAGGQRIGPYKKLRTRLSSVLPRRPVATTLPGCCGADRWRPNHRARSEAKAWGKRRPGDGDGQDARVMAYERPARRCSRRGSSRSMVCRTVCRSSRKPFAYQDVQ